MLWQQLSSVCLAVRLGWAGAPPGPRPPSGRRRCVSHAPWPRRAASGRRRAQGGKFRSTGALPAGAARQKQQRHLGGCPGQSVRPAAAWSGTALGGRHCAGHWTHEAGARSVAGTGVTGAGRICRQAGGRGGRRGSRGAKQAGRQAVAGMQERKAQRVPRAPGRKKGGRRQTAKRPAAAPAAANTHSPRAQRGLCVGSAAPG